MRERTVGAGKPCGTPTPRDHVLMTSAEMDQADRLAVGSQTHAGALMEAGGGAVAVAIGARWSMRSVTVLCGSGNNGGDGFVAARHLAAAGRPVTVALMKSRAVLSGEAACAASLWIGPIAAFSPKCLDGAGFVVDAIFGTGLSRPLSGSALSMVDAIKGSQVPVCAIDVPSGLDGSNGAVLGAAAPADLTVTFFSQEAWLSSFPRARAVWRGRSDRHRDPVFAAEIYRPQSLGERSGPLACSATIMKAVYRQSDWPKLASVE
jgi:hydroxyethylthiazole kinase-like uncharacterized protein yjeF